MTLWGLFPAPVPAAAGQGSTGASVKVQIGGYAEPLDAEVTAAG
ncbi:hypothetical protein ACFQYP_58550 [Nonomuraea antimicrobica]